MQIIIDMDKEGVMRISSPLNPVATSQILIEAVRWKLTEVKLEPEKLVKVAKAV